jgi:polyferredoxin
MDSIKKPRGLIKYSSINNIENREKFRFTPRLTFYSIILVALLSVFFIFLINRSPVEATILRARGSTFFINDKGNVVNIFTVKLINKSFDKMNIRFLTEGYSGKFKLIGTENLLVKPEAILEGTFLLEIPKKELKGAKNKIRILLFNGQEKVDSEKTIFSGPGI